jgi:MFS family permease
MMGSLGALGGVLGIMIPALIADRLAVRDLRWYLWVSAIGGGLIIPSALLFLFNNGTHLYALYFVATIFGATYMAPVVALTQRLLPLHLRALSSAIILLSFNIIGVAGGNLVTGALSDALRSTFGVESIRYAMALTLSGSVVGVALMAYSSHRLFRDMTSGKTTST